MNENIATIIAICNLIAVIVALPLAWGNLKTDLALTRQGLSELKKDFEALAATDRRLAVMEERLANQGKMLSTSQIDIQQLRSGRGYITEEN